MHIDYQYSWDEILPIAEKLTCEINGNAYLVWGADAELAWAEKAWYALQRSGLTTYSNECEKMLVQSQVLTLAAMFCKFIELYFDKPVIMDYAEWFDDMNLDLFRLETALGIPLTAEWKEKEVWVETFVNEDAAEDFLEEVTETYSDGEYDQETISDAVRKVIHYQYGAVAGALLQFFGGEELLYVSLIRSQERGECRAWIYDGMKLDFGKKTHL